MDPTSNSTNPFNDLPIELFVAILLLSFNTPLAELRIMRAEQLRLVNREWKAAIDCTPHFWAYIPNHHRAKLKAIKRWIKKSGEVPLHIVCTRPNRPPAEFMPLVTPYAHRWRSIELMPNFRSISGYIMDPVPLLEVLEMSSASIPRDTIIFGGVHPALSTVRLTSVILPDDTRFLRNLRSLHLESVSGPSGRLSLSNLHAILTESPNLEQLVIDPCYTNDMQQPPPILLPNLASFRLAPTIDLECCPTAILTMIRAPSVTHFQVDFHNTTALSALDILSPVVGRLRQASNLVIAVSFDTFELSAGIQSQASYTSGGVTIGLSQHAERMEGIIMMLREIDTAISPPAAVELTIEHDDHTMELSRYLWSRRDGGFPLPGLRTVHLRVPVWNTNRYKEMIVDLARTRTDIPRISVQVERKKAKDEKRFRWDAERMKLVLSEGGEGGTGGPYCSVDLG